MVEADMAPAPNPKSKRRPMGPPVTEAPAIPAAPQVPPGSVALAHGNYEELSLILLQQTRDWLIRNHRQGREIAYYLRCIADGTPATDEGAKAAINAPPEQV